MRGDYCDYLVNTSEFLSEMISRERKGLYSISHAIYINCILEYYWLINILDLLNYPAV